MRKFYLINELNIRYDLQNIETSAFIADPSGLGYSTSISYVRIGNSFLEESRNLNQNTFEGDIYFKDYAKYQEFIFFVEQAKQLRLIYKPLDVEYFRDVDFSSITKTELESRSGYLICPIKLMCKGLYYTEDNKRFIVESVAGESRYSVTFPFMFNDYSNVSVTYNNTGHDEAELLAEIYGYTVNPTLELFVNEVLVSSMTFNITVQPGQKLLYSAKDGDNYVALEDANGNQTPIPSCLSLANDNFFKIPKGYSTIQLSSDTAVINPVMFRIMTAYKGV